MIRFLSILMLIIFCDAIVNSYFFMYMILQIATYARHIQGGNLAYLISAAFIFIFDVLIAFSVIFHFYFLYGHKFQEILITLKTFFGFNFIRIIVGIIYFSNHNSFEETQNCFNSNVDLCQINDLTEFEHYISFGIQTVILIPLFIIYCKF